MAQQYGLDDTIFHVNSATGMKRADVARAGADADGMMDADDLPTRMIVGGPAAKCFVLVGMRERYGRDVSERRARQLRETIEPDDWHGLPAYDVTSLQAAVAAVSDGIRRRSSYLKRGTTPSSGSALPPGTGTTRAKG